jgi:CarD family transcriptional regulator
MASVKKTMKSSKTKQANKTKQAKQPGTAKAKASNQSAVTKAKRVAAARALAARKLAISKPGRKTTTKAAVVTRRANSPVAAKPAARKKASAARAAPRASNTIRAAKKGATRSAKPVRARATGGASARANAKSVSGKTARRASVNKPARGKPAAAAKKTPVIEVSRRVAAKPAAAARKAVESPTRTAQNTAASKAAAAAILALKRNAARLSEARKQAASPPAERPAGNSSKLDLASKERVAVIKKSEQEISTGSALGPTDAIVARVLAKRAAAGGPLQTAAKGSGKPFAAEITTKTLDSQTPLSIASRPGARAPARLDAAQTNMAEAKPGEKSVPPAHKPAKTATSQRQLFKPHEYVVYPAHGVGQIVAIEEQEVAGFKLELFVVRFVRDKMILKVPTPKAASVGMRRLADAPAVKAALDTLTGRARVKRTMWSRRAQEYEAKINSGDLKAIAEVVRDLYRSDTQPEQSYSERQLYETALDRMAREILVVQKLTETESLKVIETQLQKGPRRGKTEEGEAEEADIEQAA